MPNTPEKQPFFSIITITLNNLEGLKRTAASIEEQNTPDFEWIVVDGDSSDGTEDFLPTTTALWSRAPDLGLYDAMNKGIERAKGTYLLFLNAGDRLVFPETLSEIKAGATPIMPGFIYGDSLEAAFGEMPAYKTARTPETLARGMFTHHQAMMFHRETLGSLRYDRRFEIAADYDLLARFLEKKPEIYYHQAPICIFESGGISQKKVKTGRNEQYKIRAERNICSPFINKIILFSQMLSWGFRTCAPNLYWRLRF
ncbi:MAG: glycosyltransferase [Alphaproteobacteria bacterium]|nr:glycosyltransferase [Alphaproteobacteria bacterium]